MAGVQYCIPMPAGQMAYLPTCQANLDAAANWRSRAFDEFGIRPIHVAGVRQERWPDLIGAINPRNVQRLFITGHGNAGWNEGEEFRITWFTAGGDTREPRHTSAEFVPAFQQLVQNFFPNLREVIICACHAGADHPQGIAASLSAAMGHITFVAPPGKTNPVDGGLTTLNQQEQEWEANLPHWNVFRRGQVVGRDVRAQVFSTHGTYLVE